MKNIFLFLLVVLIACNKTKSTVIVVKDCTGTYLRYNGTDYWVCNFKILEEYPSGTEVKATFKPIGKRKCEAFEYGYCAMVHGFPTGEAIKITSVK